MTVKEDLTSCLLDNNKLVRDIIYTAQQTASSHVSLNSSSTAKQHHTFSDQFPSTINTTDIKINVQRIERSLLNKCIISVRSLLSTVLSLPVLALLVSVAVYKTTLLHIRSLRDPRNHIEEKDLHDELITHDETYYIQRWGYEFDTHKVLTPDGYILTMHRIFKKNQRPTAKDATKKPPVLIGHGLFQCSGAFVLNEEKSLAFTLVDAGYDVWVGNNRSIAGLEHISLSHKDHEYWNWGIKELGVYDFCSMIHHVKLHSQVDKVAYIGHSQGNAQAFVALSLCPEIAESLSCFIALAPAVCAGELVKNFPLRLLIGLNAWFYTLLFGNGCFLPIMSVAQTIIEPKIFCFLAYSMFSYLFNWWDHHWLRRRKAKYFQFTPRPVSAQLISDWIAGWGRQGVLLYVQQQQQQQQQPQTLSSNAQPTTASSTTATFDTVTDYKTKVPLIIFYGTADYLVDGQKCVEMIQTCNPFPMLDLVHVERLEGYEHMDTIWGHDNHITTYPVILEHLKKISLLIE